MGVWPDTDWPKLIETHRQALLGVLASLVTLATCLGGGPTVPRHLQRTVMRLLRPAESAARRLIILAARRLALPEVSLPPWRPRRRKLARTSAFLRRPGGTGILLPRGFAWPPRPEPASPPSFSPGGDASARPPAFRLLDPIRRVSLRRYPVRSSVPRILFPGIAEPFRIVKQRHDDAVDATSISRRLAALTAALTDIPAQATRFLRWEARQARARAAGRRRLRWPLRAGRPPGQTRARTHDVHDVLEKLHDMASYALEYPDSS